MRLIPTFVRRRVVGRLRDALTARVATRLVPEPLRPHDRAAQVRDFALEAAGVTLESRIKVRSDGKGVYLVRHPRHGLCVLKTSFAGQPQLCMAARYRTELVRGASAPLFPRVLDAGTHWLLEEHVDGRPFPQWLEEDFAPEPFVRFMNALERWSEHVDPPAPRNVLPEWQVQELVAGFLVKCLRQTRLYPLRANLRTFRTLGSPGSALRDRLLRLEDAASRVVLPEGLMCKDLNARNVRVRATDAGLVIVDYEAIGPGHWGFDIAYMLSTVGRGPHPVERLERMRQDFGSLLRDAGPGFLAFFMDLTDVLTEMGAAVHRERWRR